MFRLPLLRLQMHETEKCSVTISKWTFCKRIYKDDENGSGLIYYHGIFLVQLGNPNLKSQSRYVTGTSCNNQQTYIPTFQKIMLPRYPALARFAVGSPMYLSTKLHCITPQKRGYFNLMLVNSSKNVIKILKRQAVHQTKN